MPFGPELRGRGVSAPPVSGRAERPADGAVRPRASALCPIRGSGPHLVTRSLDHWTTLRVLRRWNFSSHARWRVNTSLMLLTSFQEMVRSLLCSRMLQSCPSRGYCLERPETHRPSFRAVYSAVSPLTYRNVGRCWGAETTKESYPCRIFFPRRSGRGQPDRTRNQVLGYG